MALSSGNVPHMTTVNLGDLFEIWTQKTYPTTYQVTSIDQMTRYPNLIIQFAPVSNPTDFRELLITPRGQKRILGIEGQYFFSNFRTSVNIPTELPFPSSVSLANLGNFETLPSEMIDQIALTLPVQDLSQFCALSESFAEFCSDSNAKFWMAKLNLEFPNRIQKESRKLGLKKYLFWLDAARRGLIPSNSRDQGYLFDFHLGDKIILDNQIFLIEDFDRFGYYPMYYLNLKRLSDQSKWEGKLQGHIYHILEGEINFLSKNQSFKIPIYNLISQGSIFIIKYLLIYPFPVEEFDELGSASQYGVFQVNTGEYFKGDIILENKVENEKKILKVRDGKSKRVKLANLEKNFQPEVFNVEFYVDQKSSDPDPDHDQDQDPLVVGIGIKWDRSFKIYSKSEYHQLQDPDTEIQKVIDFLFQAFPEHIGRCRKWIETEAWKAYSGLTYEEAINKLISEGWLIL